MNLTAGNPKVQRLRRLIGRRSARYEERVFVVEGDVLVREASQAGITIEEIFVREDRQGAEIIQDLIRIPAYVLSESVFNGLSDTTTPQGIAAICQMPENIALTCDPSVWVIIADGVSDPGNLGTIMRSCEVAGATALVLVNNTVDPFSPKVVRSSAGAVFHLPIITDSSFEDLMALGMHLIGTTSRNDIDVTPTSYISAKYSGCLGVVLGNEAHGISAEAPVHEWITIDHVGRSESLNVAMTASILAMHIARERCK